MKEWFKPSAVMGRRQYEARGRAREFFGEPPVGGGPAAAGTTPGRDFAVQVKTDVDLHNTFTTHVGAIQGLLPENFNTVDDVAALRDTNKQNLTRMRTALDNLTREMTGNNGATSDADLSLFLDEFTGGALKINANVIAEIRKEEAGP